MPPLHAYSDGMLNYNKHRRANIIVYLMRAPISCTHTHIQIYNKRTSDLWFHLTMIHHWQHISYHTSNCFWFYCSTEWHDTSHTHTNTYIHICIYYIYIFMLKVDRHVIKNWLLSDMPLFLCECVHMCLCKNSNSLICLCVQHIAYCVYTIPLTVCCCLRFFMLIY